MNTAPGQKIDRYRIIERLGMGGMAIIYKAYDTRLARDVAVKLIRTQAIPAQQHERLLKRFEREAKAQAKFNHPNIVPVYDYGVHDGSPYLVMEYIPGGTLKDRITGPVDYKQAVAWVLPIADALGYAHAHGIVHRDVKPSNILVNSDNQPILTDFGIAKILENTEGTLTGTGMGVGTPEYMAPEQWRGETSEASDQYTLGVVLYELLTGQKPFTAETPVAIALKQMKDPLTRPSQLVPGIPEEVEKVIFKALAKNPKDRYESMGAFRQALAGTISQEGMSLGSAERDGGKPNRHAAPPKGNRKTTGRRGGGWLWGLGSLMAIAGILLVVIELLGSNDSGLGRNVFGEASVEDAVSAIAESTLTLTQHATETVAVSPPGTSTATPTMTQTPEPHYSIYYISGDYSLINLDLLSNSETKILDLIPSGRPDEEFIWERFTALWSNDGRYLLYSPADSSGNRYSSGLFLYDLSNKQMIVISDKIDRYYLHGFSPDNKSIIYSSNAKGIPGLYIFNILESSNVLISLGNQFFLDSEWNHDGNELYFASDNSVYKYNRNTNQKELIVDNSLGLIVDLVLSPKGDLLFISSTEGHTQWLSAINIQQKTIFEVTDKTPRWDFHMWFFSNNDSVLTGSWIGTLSNDPYSSQGIFNISLEDLNIVFFDDEIFEHFYRRYFIFENDRFYLFEAFDNILDRSESCFSFSNKMDFSLIKEICSNDFGSSFITRDQRFLFIQRATKQIYQIELSSDFEISIVDIENQILRMNEGIN